MDARAQSIGIARYFLALIVGAIMWFILSETTDPMLDRANQTTTNSTANQATSWFSQGVQWFPIFVLLVSFFGLIVYSIFIRERRR
jgi:hypothetical protein